MADEQDRMHEIAQDSRAGDEAASNTGMADAAAGEATEMANAGIDVAAEAANASAASRGSSKASADLEAAKASAGKVAYAAAQLRELIEESGFASDPLGTESTSSSWPDGASQQSGQTQPLLVDEAIAADRSVFLQATEGYDAAMAAQPPLVSPVPPPPSGPHAQPGPASTAPTPAFPSSPSPEQQQAPVWQPASTAPMQQAAQPQAQPTSAPAGAGQQGYWRGFVPVELQQSGQPARTVQPSQPVQPIQPPQAAQAAQPVQAAQARSPFQPTQPVQYAQPTQPLQGQAAQPAYTRTQQAPAQAYTAAQQTYTPQIQQPAPYVPADNLTIPQQPNTPAYAKTKSRALPIVIVAVVALLAVIAAIGIGRLLATVDNAGDNPLVEQLSPIEDDANNGPGANGEPDANGGSDSNGAEGYYHDHDWGGSGNGSGNGSDGSQNDSGGGMPGYGFGDDGDAEDLDGLFDWNGEGIPGYDYDYNQNGGSGAVHISGGGIDADDGELHDAWDKSVSYRYSDQEYQKEGSERIDFYDMQISYDFDVDYPQLEGDIENLDAINEALKSTAMRTVESSYLNPTEEVKKLVESFAVLDNTSNSTQNAADALLESDVDYAVSYNNGNLASVSFSDEYAVGSRYGSFIALRTVNANLKTGELYELDDVLELNEDIAGAFVDNLSSYDSGSAMRIAGRDAFIQAILGKGDLANNVSTTFFIDGNGKVNLGVTYAVGSSGGTARGWWDYTLTDEQLEKAKKDSSLWDALS